VDEQNVRLPTVELSAVSKQCDAILDEFATSAWYKANVPGGGPTRFERAMCKTFLGYLLTQKAPTK
jgi:hypothetical protein